MGNREALLSGAVRCLYEKGYARTTARDVAKASRVSLAAIGYHFGSVETLLNTALIEATQRWGDELERALVVESFSDLSALARFEAIWARIIALFETHRPLWAAQLEALGQAERAPELREYLAGAQDRGRLALASLFQRLDESADREVALAVGSFHQALLFGVMSQWMADPQHAPSARDLGRALEVIVEDATRSPDTKRARAKKKKRSGRSR